MTTFAKAPNLAKFLFCVSILSIITACQPKKLTPEATTRKFLTALAAENWDEAKTVSSKSTAEMLEVIKTVAAMTEKKDRPDQSKQKIEKMTCKETGDTAVCSYCCNAEQQPASLNLIKENGKWCVNLNKDEETEPQKP